MFSFIDFFINGLSTENSLRSQRISAPYKIKANNYKLLDLVIRIEFNSTNFNAVFLKFSEKIRSSFSHVFIFGNMFSRFRCYAGCKLYQRYMLEFIPI